MPLLFSYGTLQQEDVQRSTFGRTLHGVPDNLVGFVVALIRIEAEDVVAKSGKEFHPIAKPTGNLRHRVPGTVFELTDDELSRSDAYEVACYRRVQATLESGRVAWAYVEAG